MQPEEDDFLKKYRGPGVSPAWQVLAIVAGLSAFILFVIAVGLGTALAFERDSTRRSFATPAPPMQFAPPAAPWNNPDADEPPNPPYPLEADLQQPFPRPIPGEAPKPKQETLHDRFLKLGREAWVPPGDATPMHPTISPDGQQIAYVAHTQLQVQSLDDPPNPVGAAAAGGMAAGPGGGGGVPGMPWGGQEGTIVGRPVWSADSRVVYFADSEGRLMKHDRGTGLRESLNVPGDCPVPVGETHLAFRRLRPKPKADRDARPDPAEVVLMDLKTLEVRVLIPEGPETPEPFAASPDGKQLVLLVTEEGEDGELGARHLELLDLEKKGPRRRLGPSGHGHNTLGWARDGRSLLLALMPLTSPPDRWEFGGPWSNGTEVYHVNLATDKTTRLSRAGAVSAFAGVSDNELFLLVLEQAPPHWIKKLRRVPVGELLKFAEAEPDREPRDAAAWAALFQQVLEKVRVAPDADGKSVTPEVLARIADEFAAGYRERFKADPPGDVAAWEHLTLELSHISVPDRVRAAVVLGAAAGEYLRRNHGAVWHLGAGRLVAASPDGKPAEELPFALEVNPFETFDEDGENYVPTLALRDVLVRADGRTVLLGNNAAELRKAAESVADADFARARELFEQKQADEAQRLLLELVKRPKHAANQVLKFHAAKLLCEHGRGKAAVPLLDPGNGPLPPNARLYNLLGLAVMQKDPKNPNAAVAHFRNAMRCDLYFGPAYLNMAMAFEKAEDPWSSNVCLRRYLKLASFGPYAADARQRLARLQEALQAAPPGPGAPAAGAGAADAPPPDAAAGAAPGNP